MTEFSFLGELTH